jgi:hypothetical protein
MISVLTDPDFTREEWQGMTAAERVALCHVLAREAGQLAQAAGGERAAVYRKIAAQWNTLAAEIEDSARETPTRPRG